MTCVSNPAHAARRLKLPVLQVQYLVSLLWNWIDQAVISWVLLYCAGDSLGLVINTLSINLTYHPFALVCVIESLPPFSSKRKSLLCNPSREMFLYQRKAASSRAIRCPSRWHVSRADLKVLLLGTEASSWAGIRTLHSSESDRYS